MSYVYTDTAYVQIVTALTVYYYSMSSKLLFMRQPTNYIRHCIK